MLDQDTALRAKSDQSIRARNELLEAQEVLQERSLILQEASIARTEQEAAVNAARAKASVALGDAKLTEAGRTQALNAVLAEENKLAGLNADLDDALKAKLEAQEDVRVARLEAERATIATLDARLAAEERLAPIVAATMDAEKTRTEAIEVQSRASKALVEAQQLEGRGMSSPEAIAARTKATELQAEATRLQAEAIKQEALAYSALDLEAQKMSTRDRLVGQNPDVRRSSAAQIQAESELLDAQSTLQAKSIALQNAGIAATEHEAIAMAARNEAIYAHNNATLTQEERALILNAAIADENKLTQLNTNLQIAQIDHLEAQGRVQAARLEYERATTEALNARLLAETQLTPVADLAVEAEVARTAALEAETAATIALAEAETLERVAQSSPEAITARTKATQLQTEATKLRAIATEQTTAAEVAYEATARASQLAEKGLAEARIFGSKVQFATTGPMGAINKLLVQEIDLKEASAAASAAWAGAGNVFKGSLEVMKVALGGTITGLGALGKAAGGAISGGLNAIVGFLGPATPLFIAAGAAALIFKDQIWGIGAASRELSKSFDEVFKKNEELQRQFGTDRRLLAFKEQVGAVGDTAQVADLDPVRQQLSQLRESGDLTTGQFNQLAKSLDAVGSSGTLNADKLKEFKSQLDAVRQGAKGEPEEGVFAPVGKGLKWLWDATINAPSNVANTFGTAVTNPIGFFNPATQQEALRQTAMGREANSLIKPLSQLGIAQGQVGQALIDTSRSIGDYNKGLGLTEASNEKLRRGAALTTADLEREQQQFEQRRKSNDQLIGSYEKTLEETVKTADKVKDPELKAELLGQADALRSQIDTLKQRNEQLKAGYDNLVKYQQVLKDLRAAITDATDPAKALAAAQDDFNQKFVVDAKGKITPFIKDINTLRTEAGRYAESITSATQYATTGPALTTSQRAAITANNPFAIIEKQGITYQDAAQRLRDVRDDMLTLPGGEKGYRLGIEQRRELTKTIVEMDQNAARERITADEIALEKQRLLQTRRKQSAEVTEKEITRLTIDQTKQQLIIKEAQIKELRGMGLKTTAEEAEASKLRIKIATTEAEQIERNRQREIALRQGQFDIEREQIKTRRSRRGTSVEQEQEQLARVEIKAARDRLKTLEEEYARSGKTDRELRQKIAIAREQLEQTIAQTEEQARERRFQKRLKQIQNQAQAEILTFQQAVAQSSARSKDLELGQQLFGSRRQLAETLSTAYEQGLQNQVKLTGDAVVRAQLEAKIVDRRLQLLPQTQAAEREQLRIQIQLNQLGLEREAIQARISKIENQRNIATTRLELQRAIRDKQSPEEIKAIQLQIQGLEQQSGIIDTQIIQAEKAKAQNKEIAANSEKELQTRQKTAQETAKVEAYLARIAVQEALINREIAKSNNAATAQTQALQKIVNLSETRAKDLELEQQLRQSRTSLLEAEVSGFEGIVQAQLKLTGDVEVRAHLEREIQERKAAALPLAQAAERESLRNQIQLNELNLEREATQARIAKIENDRNLKQAQLELQKAQLEKKSPEEIEAINLSIKGYEQQGELLNQREGQANRAIAQSKELASNQLKELDIRQRTATVNSQVELTLARAAEKQAAIAKQVQIIDLLSQQRQLDLQGETKQLEAQNQTLDQRKQLLEAQQNIIKGQIDSQTSQLSIASEATKSELKRRELASAIAAIKLRSVLQQIEYERQILQLNQQQQKMALEREKTQNRIAQATNLADIAKAQAEIAKVQASPTATPLEMAAAQMNLRAKLEERAGLRFSGALLEQRGQVEERLRQYERQGQEQKYAAQYNQARLDFAQTLPEGRQREAMAQLYNDALSAAVGSAGQQGVRGIRDLAESQFFGANRAAYMYRGSGYAQPQMPNIQAPDYEKYRRDALAQFQEFAVKPPDLSAQIQDLTVRSPQVKIPALDQVLQQQQQPAKQGDTHFNIEVNLPAGASPKEISQQLDTGEVVQVFADIWNRVKQMRS